MRILSGISLLILCFTLTSCGFSPMYGENSATQNTAIKSHFNQIDITIIPDRSGQYLRNALIDNLYQDGYPTNPKYKLIIKPIKETIADFDVTIDSESTRQQIKLRTDMTLIDNTSDETVLTRTLIAITSNNILESEFSTIITEQSAREAALNDLARQIERQLALHFSK